MEQGVRQIVTCLRRLMLQGRLRQVHQHTTVKVSRAVASCVARIKPLQIGVETFYMDVKANVRSMIDKLKVFARSKAGDKEVGECSL